MTEPLRPSDEELAALGVVWVDLAAATTSGLPYPASSDPVANGAANIKALADAVTAVYPLPATPGPTFYPNGGAVPAGTLVKVAAGKVDLTFDAAGQAVLTVAGVTWTTLLAVSVLGVVSAGAGADSTFTAAGRNGNTAYVYGYRAGVKLTGAAGVNYIAFGY